MRKIKNKLRIWLGIEEDLINTSHTLSELHKSYSEKDKEIQLQIDQLEKELKRVVGLSNQNKDKIVSQFKRIDSMRSELHDTSKAMSDVYKTVESVVNIGADVRPDTQHDKSWAVVCVEGKMNIVKFLPLNHKDAHSMLQYLKSFPTSKSVYDTTPFWKDFGW